MADLAIGAEAVRPQAPWLYDGAPQDQTPMVGCQQWPAYHEETCRDRDRDRVRNRDRAETRTGTGTGTGTAAQAQPHRHRHRDRHRDRHRQMAETTKRKQAEKLNEGTRFKITKRALV